MTLFGYNFSIPILSIALILIDLLLDITLKHNFIKQLLFKASTDYVNVYRNIFPNLKIVKSQPKDFLTYEPEIFSHPRAFITVGEQNWLEARIRQFYGKS